jgi:demethoxyubiquinone hydroxylase (CLK1/Coq7/Cat5 family)
MFTEQDYREYFADLEKAEGKMIKCLDDILPDITDAELLKTLNSIRSDELRHLNLEKELFAILGRR